MTTLEYCYVLVLVGIAVFAFTARGYVPSVEPPSSVFESFEATAGTFATRPIELYQTVDLVVHVPPTQLLGRGSLFDVEAVATFGNAATGDSFVTHAFYDGGADGNAVYRFRFTPTSPGTWTVSTTSEVGSLTGVRGNVDVVPSSEPRRLGFLGSADGRFAAPVAATQTPVAIDYQVYFRGGWPLENLGALPREEEPLREALTDLLTEADANGFDAVLVGVWHQWFELGVSRSDRHFSVDPDPETFRVLETLAFLAHERGMFLHVWQWGDEERRWSPLGILADARSPGDVGGVNGVADRRLQRYIAARLGPLPNWSMSYGFDLNEWADEDAVRDWAQFILARSARPHLLTGMEVRRSASSLFDLGQEKLGLVSKTRVAEAAILGASAGGGSVPMVVYDAAAIEVAAAAGSPVIFETRYLYLRDDLWTMERTRRSMWSLSMAGGVGAIWGVDWDLQEPYSHPEQLRTHRTFWTGRAPREALSTARSDGSLALMSPSGDYGVIYALDSDSVALPPVPAGAVVWAVDTVSEYHVIEVTLPAGSGEVQGDVTGARTEGEGSGFTWQAPYVSDWAVAIETPPR